MTYAAVSSIMCDRKIAEEWLPRIFSPEYDPRFILPEQKRGVTLGMRMTEKQGGSDLRSNTTTATPIAGREYQVVGHKWFFSALMSDAFLILAQAPPGLSCFFLPRFTPEGEVNDIRIQRLKDKLGDRSNAGSEVLSRRVFSTKGEAYGCRSQDQEGIVGRVAGRARCQVGVRA